MSFFKRLTSRKKKTKTSSKVDRGILVFEHTSEVIKAESILKKAGWNIRVMGPPPEIRSGCDLVIEIPLIEKLNILRTLENLRTPPLENSACQQSVAAARGSFSK